MQDDHQETFKNTTNDNIDIESHTENAIQDTNHANGEVREETILDHLDIEIGVLQEEIRKTKCKFAKSRIYRYLVDVEDRNVIYKENPTRFIKNDERFIKNDENNIQNIEFADKVKRVKYDCIKIEDDKYFLDCIKKSIKFYEIARQLPLIHILRHSNKVVFTEEWIFAYEELRIVKVLGKIEKYRSKKKLVYLLNEVKDSVILKNEIKKNNDLRNKTKNELRNESRNESSARYKETFEAMRTVKSKTCYNIPQPKKTPTATHSSHLSVLSKITPDLFKIQDPSGIVEYKNRSKRMYMNDKFARNYLTGSVSFNVNRK